MITPSFSITATERILPRLTLDFTNPSLSSLVTFVRSGATATRVNSSGYIESVAANTPRFDYNPVTLVCNGLLIEDQRTNIILDSGDFSSLIWNKLNATIDIVAITSPLGNANSQKLAETAVNGEHRLLQNFVSVSTQSYTLSFYAKASERNWIACQLVGNMTGFPFVYFNLQNGTTGATNTSASNFSITPAGNGWYRCTLTAVANGTISAFNIWNASANGTVSYQGVTGSGALFDAVQVESSAFASSYIPTAASQVTRTADEATITGTNFSNWYNASEGSAVIQAIQKAVSGTCPTWEFDDNTSNESIALRSVSTDPQLFVVDGGATQATLDAGTISANTIYKMGGAWKASSFATAIDGASAVAQAYGTLPTVTQARLGSDGVNYLNGCLQNFRYWPQRIVNAEVQSFTK
jgi:hypothetical protein